MLCSKLPRTGIPAAAERSFLFLAFCLLSVVSASAGNAPENLKIRWEKNWLRISGANLQTELPVIYMEAYCRPGSTNRDWSETVIPHKTHLVSSEGNIIKLKDTLADGVIVEHTITAGSDEVDFQVTAHNPTDKPSEVHWAQPCLQLGKFSGLAATESMPADAPEDYLKKCFIYLDGKLTRMPTQPWAQKGFYTPGQVWCPSHVPRSDVNPRPLSELIPDNGLIGCFSADEKQFCATAWEPYQELFQGIYRCLHSDFRIGGLAPGEKKTARGKIYILNDVGELERRYRADFPVPQAK